MKYQRQLCFLSLILLCLLCACTRPADHGRPSDTDAVTTSDDGGTTGSGESTGTVESVETAETTVEPVTETEPERPYIRVFLEAVEGLVIHGENPVRVLSGEDAVFEVSLAPGYVFVPGEGMKLSGGYLTVSGLRYPTTVVVECVPKEVCEIAVDCDRPELGQISVTAKDGKWVEYGKEVTVTATPVPGAIFLGYSEGRSLTAGGALISDDADYTFVAADDVRLFANFSLAAPAPLSDPAKEQRVIYHANGGEAFGHLDTFYFDYKDDYYYFPNALPDLGYLTRDGYVLAGYTTRPDGQGDFVGCGWNAVTDAQGVAELYALWLPETPASAFTFALAEDGTGWIVTRYTGTHETVVIPETYQGRPVVGVAGGAFDGADFTTLMITKNIRVVADGAIRGCTSFERLIFSDGVTSISDLCISECPAFTTLSMHAVMMPRYCDDREGTYAIKYEHLRASAGLPKILVVAGSNCAYGLDSTILYEALKNDYDIINYGCNAYSPALFYLEACLPYITGDDILLLVPEDNDFQFGRGEVRPYIWHFFEAAYEAFAEVDQRHFTNTFNSFADFNATRMNMRPKTYQDKTRETTNRFGDYCALKVGHTASFDPFTVANKTEFHPANVTRYVDALNRSLERYAARGASVWTSFSVVNRNYLKDDSLPGGSAFEKYVDTVRKKVHATVISDMADYIMEPQYFYNSHQHLNTEGTTIRSQRLLEDIRRQLEIEKGKGE